MSENPLPPSPTVNEITQQAHRRQFMMQILAPTLVGATLLVALLVLVTLSDQAYVSRWADISLIWLLPCQMVSSFLTLALLGGIAFGLWKLLTALPRWMFKIQNVFTIIKNLVRRFADQLVEPALRVHSFNAKTRATRRATGEQVQHWFPVRSTHPVNKE
jgi:hypothetical protein